ncbi:MAG: hypothetical protein KF760_32320 [Candidatus Eremiobacteraeota bacterium]|nr:hypothetical protein [Candidatus Eremiobacteraeota bacterium]MCW5871588.1 hypothetical protein [Candidatus Eremiobacteraeota bacterium]
MQPRLLLLLALLAFWCWTHPPVLQLWTGRCSYEQLAFLRAHGARVRPTEHGLRIVANRGGVRALACWCAHLQRSRELVSQNLANAHTYETAEGTPYRRRFVAITPAGESFVNEDRGDYNWVYDPTNPNALQDGEHKGYVPMPNVNESWERSQLQLLNEEVPRYRQALEELSRMTDPTHRLDLDPLVEEPAKPESL